MDTYINLIKDLNLKISFKNGEIYDNFDQVQISYQENSIILKIKTLNSIPSFIVSLSYSSTLYIRSYLN
jgi:hypothetical protein